MTLEAGSYFKKVICSRDYAAWNHYGELLVFHCFCDHAHG